MDVVDFDRHKKMMSSQSSLPHRAVVEHWVRQAVYQRMGQPVPRLRRLPTLVVRLVRGIVI